MDSIREQILSSMHDDYAVKTASKLQGACERLAREKWEYFKERIDQRRLYEMVAEQISGPEIINYS